MKLWAISDLHLDYEHNRDALQRMQSRATDWLIVAGDVGHGVDHFHFAFEQLCKRFGQVIWTPGNHDLWTTGTKDATVRGQARYEEVVTLCRQYKVLTPEDPYPLWPGSGAPRIIVPLFLLYDYTFRPNHIPVEQALNWAQQDGIVCADEYYLHHDPFPSRAAWCHERCALSEERIGKALAATPDAKLILANHWPLLEALAVLPRIPRFMIWCGTRLTNDWHHKYPVECVVYGHLHIRRSTRVDGVRFEEVSLGYPRNWDADRGIDGYLRELL